MSGWYDEDSPTTLQKPMEDFGPDGTYFGDAGRAKYQADLDAYNKQQTDRAPKLRSRDEFMATVKPEMLDATGKFKGPQAGVNFMLEGFTPDEVYQTANGIAQQGEWSDDNRLGKLGACTIVRSRASSASPATNDWSILSVVIGQHFRCWRQE